MDDPEGLDAHIGINGGGNRRIQFRSALFSHEGLLHFVQPTFLIGIEGGLQFGGIGMVKILSRIGVEKEYLPAFGIDVPEEIGEIKDRLDECP